MLIPRNRLLFWFAVIVLPFSFLGAVEPAAFLFSVAAIGLFFILVFVDGLSTRLVMAGVSIELPAVARLSKGREGQLEVRIQNGSRKPRVVSLAIGLPLEIPSAQEQVQLALLQDS